MVIFEPQCAGYVHAEVNAAYILTCARAFPEEKIRFFGEAEHLRIVEEELGKYGLNIRYIPIEIPDRKQSPLKRLRVEFGNIRKVFSQAEGSDVLLMSVTSATLLAAKLFGYVFPGKIHIVLHGILETIFKKPESLSGRLFWFKPYLLHLNRPKIRYLLNGESIERNLVSSFPSLEKFVSSLELPYFFEGNPVKETTGPLPVFASVGVGAVQKGSHLFFRLAQDVAGRTGKNAEFRYIGHFVDREMDGYINEFVDLPSKDSPLDRQSYEKYMTNADFVVLFYPGDSYKFGASGAFFDAIKFRKPVIAIRNDFLSHYFDKYGELGWLCESYEEVLKIVRGICENFDREDYERRAENLGKVREDLSMEKQAARLRRIMA